MKDFLRRSFGLDGRSVGASLDGGRLTVVQARRSGKGVSIEECITLPLASPEEARAAHRAIQDAGVRRDGVTAVFPQRLAVVKFLRLPSRVPREIAGMVSLQASRQMPFSPEEVLTDFEILSSGGDGYSRVMMTVVRRDDVRGLLEGLRGAGLSPARLVSGAQAAAPLFAAPGPTFLVDLDAGSATLALLDGGRLRFVRSVPLGVSSLAGDSAPWRERLVREVVLSLRACAQEDPVAVPSKILLAGALEGRDALARSLREAFPDCSVETPAVGGREERGFSTLSSLGAAFFPKDRRPRLLPSETGLAGGRSRGRGEKTAFAFLSVLILIAVAGILGRRVVLKRERIASLDRQWKEISGEARELRRLDGEIGMIKARLNEKGSLPGLLARLNRLVPPRVSLTTVEYERGRSLGLQGSAFVLSDAVELVNGLQKAGLFQAVELRSSSTRVFHGKELVEFGIDCVLPREGE